MKSAGVGTILVCLDRSAFDRQSIGYALALARATHGSLLLVEILEFVEPTHPRPVDTVGSELARAEAAQYLRELEREIRGLGVTVRSETREGRPAEQILHVAEREKVDLIVIGSHGCRESATFRLGSTAHQVIHHARQSVLLVRRHPESPDLVRDRGAMEQRIERVLVLLDGSSAAEGVIPEVLKISRTQGSEVLLCHIVADLHWPSDEPPSRRDSALLDRVIRRREEIATVYLHSAERRLRAQDIRCRVVTRAAESVRHGVLSVAAEEHVDLIMLTSHGQTCSDLVVHGSVAQQLLIYAEVPVYVVQTQNLTANRYDSILSIDDRRASLARSQ